MQNTPSNHPVKRKSKRIYIIVAVIAVLAILGSFMKKSNNNAEEDTKNIEVASRANAAKVTAQDLYGAYKNNEIGADETYKNKMLQVSGTITDIGTDLMNDPFVELDNGVQCIMQDKTGLASLSKGQAITISGICNGKTIYVLLEKGQIL